MLPAGSALFAGLYSFHEYITHFSQKSKPWRCAKRYFSHVAQKNSRSLVNNNAPDQSPPPGLDEKCSSSLLGTPSQCLASAGGSFLAVMFGQIFANSALSATHFSIPGSVSGLIASIGHSGSQTPQSMHSSGWITSMFSPS